MHFFLFSIFAIIFCFINYKIIISDQKTKKIPNKHLLQLLTLLPFWYIFLYFFPIWDFEIFGFIFQIFLSFLISFLLFHFGIWRAWDAKYLLVLSLFIPYIGIIPFIGNLGLLTLFYLFLYFLWFFFGKSLIHKWYFKNLLQSIKTDICDRWRIYKNNKWWKTFSVILKWLIVFLIIFVSIRLARIYLFLEFFQNFSTNENLLNIFQKYHFYLVFFLIGVTIWLFYIWRKIILFLKKFFAKKLKINISLIWNIFLGIIFLWLLGFIIFEFKKNPDEISNYLIKIFTIYIAIYIFAKIIFYSYKLSFLTSEEKFIHIDDLKVWDIVDKKYLLSLTPIQTSYDISYLKKHSGISSWIEYIKNLRWGITEDQIKWLKIIIEETNLFHIESKTTNYKSIQNIKIISTFSFWKYIFISFIITFLLQNYLIISLIYTVNMLLRY